ncbi:MAG: DUF3748 domain-containing protein [Ignavibacteriae bacterium]|nr:DUF3748 domain-containing protein [Ignavibacteriota bacterium]
MQNNNEIIFLPMVEKQLTNSSKNHALDNNDNFSPDGNYLCYDTRATIYNENLANCKSIEKVEIATGVETILWQPENITGENAAPGIAAVSYHPKENKVIFIHGPFLSEVKHRGYYNIRNRNGVEVDGNGKGILTKVDFRDILNSETTHGAHRGGTHRHEYSRTGNRIGFTYDDFILQTYDRTIGYLEKSPNSANEATHFFSVILKPSEIGKSKPGEIEKANDDSWVDSLGTMRAFIGKVRNGNGIDYSSDLFVADIPLDVDITSSFSGNKFEYPNPAKGIKIRRLTNGMKASGIVRGSFDGKSIAFTALDENSIKQLFIIKADGSQIVPKKVTNFNSDVNNIRWHANNNWIFFISNGNIFAANVDLENSGLTIQFTNDNLERSQLVVSNDGKLLAYVIPTETKDKKSKVIKDAVGRDFMQIFIMQINWDEINSQ